MDAVAYPVTSGLGDIFTDLLWRETKRTDLGGKRGGGTDLTTRCTEVDDLLLVGVEFWCWRGALASVVARMRVRG